MKMIKSLTILIIVLLCNNVNANDTIVVASNMFRIDHSKTLIVINQDVNSINATWTQLKSVILLDDTYYDIVTPLDSVQIGVGYEVLNVLNNQDYMMYFTQLPIISISTIYEIVDEPKVLANFTMVETNQNEITSNMGIEYRGVWSQTLPKKSFRIEFWSDTIGNDTEKISLLGMRTDDDWNLQAMYNEPLRFRSKTNNDLWRTIHTPYYISSEPDAKSGIQMKYAELFLNGEYRGLYCVSERVDRKQLKLKKYDGSIRGELYKGVSWGDGTVIFENLPPYNNSSILWDGFEYKYPEDEVDWINLYDFVDFVMHESNEVFYSEYQSEFNIDNAVDYFLFLNLLRASDNTGKNIYIARYKTNDPYFYVPWDLDGTFGIVWDGSQMNITSGLLSNGFFDRLWKDCSENGFREKLQLRWNDLRSNIISDSALTNMFQVNYNYLTQNAIYEKESIAWNDYSLDTTQISYMSGWTNKRLIYLDEKINDTCVPIGINSVKKLAFKVYPNPVSDFLYIDCEVPNTLNVEIYNVYGQLIKTACLSREENRISLNGLSNGLYFINIRSKDYDETMKIAVQR